MKKLMIFLFILLINITEAAFQNYGWSARAEGMGGVFTSLSNEPLGVYYNPAGIYYVYRKTLQSMYSRPYFGIEGIDFSLTNISLVIPTKRLSFGISYNNFNANNIYYEDIFILSFANNLNKIYNQLPSLIFGLNFKYMIKKFTFDDEILYLEPELKNNDSKSVFSFDLGVIYKMFYQNLSLGFTLKDINQPTISINDNFKDYIPLSISCGITYNFGDLKTFVYLEDLTLGLDLGYRFQQWGDFYNRLSYAVGVETYLNYHTLAFRFGINKNSINFGFGYDFSFGYDKIRDYKKYNLAFNYNFGIPTIFSENSSNHRISFEIKF